MYLKQHHIDSHLSLLLCLCLHFNKVCNLLLLQINYFRHKIKIIIANKLEMPKYRKTPFMKCVCRLRADLSGKQATHFVGALEKYYLTTLMSFLKKV